MNCDFVPTADIHRTGRLIARCIREGCGNFILLPATNPRATCKANLPERTEPCLHLGEQTRVQRCETCAGNLRIKVMACAVFGECTIGTGKDKGRLPGVACCQGCNSYEPAATALQ